MLKRHPGYQGLYQTINNELLSRQGRGREFVNTEQDLGLEGLRRAKRSYPPMAMVWKYAVKKV